MTDKPRNTRPLDIDERMPFEQICSLVRPILRSVVDARLNPELRQRLDPSDIVQEALLEAHVRLPDFLCRRPMPLVGWLRETALQQLAVAIRRHRDTSKRSVLKQLSLERSSVCQLVERLTADQETPEQKLLQTERASATLTALQLLSGRDREILLLRYINELSNADAAMVLQVSETVASKRHCRALVKLQKELEALGY